MKNILFLSVAWVLFVTLGVWNLKETRDSQWTYEILFFSAGSDVCLFSDFCGMFLFFLSFFFFINGGGGEVFFIFVRVIIVGQVCAGSFDRRNTRSFMNKFDYTNLQWEDFNFLIWMRIFKLCRIFYHLFKYFELHLQLNHIEPVSMKEHNNIGFCCILVTMFLIKAKKK